MECRARGNLITSALVSEEVVFTRALPWTIFFASDFCVPIHLLPSQPPSVSSLSVKIVVLPFSSVFASSRRSLLYS